MRYKKSEHVNALGIRDKSDHQAGIAQFVDSRSSVTTQLQIQGMMEACPGVIAQRKVQESMQKTGTPVQLRGENPHANPGSTGGWERTDHHVIAHAKLGLGLDALDEKDKLDVIIASVPDVLSAAMMNNLKITLKHQNTDLATRELEVIRNLIVSPTFNGDIRGIRVADIRHSFFEWMGGNQFAGPNTSIRTEPKADKDAIDTDGEYFIGDHYEQLNAQGENLYTELNKGDGKDKAKIKSTLIEITKIAKNVPASAFDPSQWVEVTDLAVLDTLAAKLGRPHMRNYAYFKVPKPDGQGTFASPYDALQTTNAGGSEFAYGTKAVAGKVGGASVFFSLAAAQVSAPNNEQVTVRQLLSDLGMVVTPVDGHFKLASVKGWRKITKDDKPHLKFDAKGLANKVFLMSGADTISERTLDETIDRALPATTLEVYLKAKGASISSWLPKELHDKALQVSE